MSHDQLASKPFDFDWSQLILFVLYECECRMLPDIPVLVKSMVDYLAEIYNPTLGCFWMLLNACYI